MQREMNKARSERQKMAMRTCRWCAFIVLAVAAALTPMLAQAATGKLSDGVAMSAASLAFVSMVAVVVMMWRHFARAMVRGLRPRWEDWGRS